MVAGDAAPGVVTIKCPVPLDCVKSLTLSVAVAPETMRVDLMGLLLTSYKVSTSPVANPVKLPV